MSFFPASLPLFHWALFGGEAKERLSIPPTAEFWRQNLKMLIFEVVSTMKLKIHSFNYTMSKLHILLNHT